MSAENYNRGKLNVLWSMLSLPKEFPGFQVLEAASDQTDLSVNPDEVDWVAFSDAVGEFQEIDTAAVPDRKLGQGTLRNLVRYFNHQFPLPEASHISDPVLHLRRIAESQLGVEGNTGATQHNPRILAYAREIGLDGIHDDETAWCSIFANWCALNSGLPHSGKPDARSWLEVGREFSNPAPGDIVVFWRDKLNSWKGHVAIFDSSGGGAINVLGGNQSNRVCVMGYRRDRLLGYRRLG